MKVAAILFFGLMSFTSASAIPDELDIRSTCGSINGNCYDNGCNGNSLSLICTDGAYSGCPCGFDCNGSGPCNAGGCARKNGRCTENYLGCTCH